MTAGTGEVDGASAHRPNPYLMLDRQVRGLGAREGRLLVVVAVAGPVLFLALGLLLGLHGATTALLVLLPTPALGVVLGLWHRSFWPADDVLSWLGRRDAADWREQVGGSIPGNAPAARAWLESHPAGSVPEWARASVMVTAGRIASARQAVAGRVAATPAELRRWLEVELLVDAREGLPVDTTAVDAAIREDPDQAPEEVAVRLACHDALVEADRGGDGLPTLLAARESLGSLPSDLAWRLWLRRFRYAVGSFAVGTWLLAMVLVGLATYGGAVWI